MPNPINPVELVKKAAVEAVEAKKPVALLFGTVISTSPLKIQVDQKAIYTEKMLILTQNVTNYEMDVNVSLQTDTISHRHPLINASDEDSEDSYTGEVEHSHNIMGTQKIKVNKGLVIGDRVLLARIQKGKKFVVLDRVISNLV